MKHEGENKTILFAIAMVILRKKSEEIYKI